MTRQWGFQLVGDFDKPGQVFVLPCPNEWIARERAAWWAGYRPDVDVRVCVSVDGDGWVLADRPSWNDVLPEAA